MKKLLPFIFLMLVLTVNSSFGQISNLKVLDKTTSFSITSGDNFGWSFNVPKAGDTTLVQIWLDTDQNGVLDASKDVLCMFFNQIDGDPHGQSGPPDVDATANKTVAFQAPLGLAPAHYIMLFRNHGRYTTFTGVVNHLASPAYTITGTVTVPAGKSRKNIVLSLEGEETNVVFWHGVTDENGNYTIEMNSDTTGNPWTVSPINSYILGPSVSTSDDYELTITPETKTYTENNFAFQAASAVVKGKLIKEDGTAIVAGLVDISGNGTKGFYYRDSRTDTAGAYSIGFLASELPQESLGLSAFSGDESNYLGLFTYLDKVEAGSTITKNMIIYKANSTITGKVLIDGKAPQYPVQVSATCADTVSVFAWTDNQGNFTINVTDKVSGYFVGAVINYMEGQQYFFTPLQAKAGATNLVLNLSTTDVKEKGASAPAEFRLSQNYPNPFNPVTTIKYSVAKEGFVSLTVYNLIGSKVATLVSEYKPAGQYSVQFDGRGLASGIYLYRLESGNFSAYKKLILMK